MKKINLILAIILLAVMAGCGGGKQSTDALIIVDVTKNYPKKELILQDFMDVEYIPLETSDEFITQGVVQDIGKDIILVKNRFSDGDIFVFDRNGKGLKKLNRLGQGGEEYSGTFRVVLDANNSEIFVNNYASNKVLVYNLDGCFIRSFKYREYSMFATMINFDSDNLFCYDGSSIDTNINSFLIISKQDGSITKEIQIPFKKKISTRMRLRDEANNMSYILGPANHYPIIPYFDDWILVEPSADTLYRYSPGHNMTPFIIRTPSVQSMDPEVFLFMSNLTERYFFMESVKKVGEFKTMQGFPTTDLMYDKQEKSIFEYTVRNNDYTDKRFVSMKSGPVSDEICAWQLIEAYQLVEDYEKGLLKGRLKEIAAKLDEEDNPVIMLVKHKK